MARIVATHVAEVKCRVRARVRLQWCMRGDAWTSGRQRDDDDDNDEQRCFLNVALDIIIIIFTALIIAEDLCVRISSSKEVERRRR